MLSGWAGGPAHKSLKLSRPAPVILWAGLGLLFAQSEAVQTRPMTRWVTGRPMGHLAHLHPEWRHNSIHQWYSWVIKVFIINPWNYGLREAFTINP